MDSTPGLCRIVQSHVPMCSAHDTCGPALAYLDAHCMGPARDPGAAPMNTVPPAIAQTPDPGPVHNGARELADLELLALPISNPRVADFHVTPIPEPQFPQWDLGQLALLLVLAGLLGWTYARFSDAAQGGAHLRPFMGLALILAFLIVPVALGGMWAGSWGLAIIWGCVLIGLGLLAYPLIHILRRALDPAAVSRAD